MKTGFLLLSLLFFTFDKPKLVKTKITPDITISVPEGWLPMSALDFNERYPSVRAPLGAFTNEERTADLSVNISATQWPDENVELAMKFYKASVINMFDKVDFINEGIKEVNGKKMIYFEFESRISGSNSALELREPIIRYNYIQFLIQPHKKRTLVFSFNCARRLRQEWEATALAIMKSVKVSK